MESIAQAPWLERASATLEDIDNLVELHLRNFDDNEMSKILGVDAIKKYYWSIIQSPYSNCTLLKHNNIAYAVLVAYSNFSKFEVVLKRSLLACVIRELARSMLTFNLSRIWIIISNYVKPSLKREIPAEIYDSSIGAVILDKDCNKNALLVKCFVEEYRALVNQLKSSKGCWTSVRASNRSMINLIKSAGLVESVGVDAKPEKILILYQVKP